MDGFLALISTPNSFCVLTKYAQRGCNAAISDHDRIIPGSGSMSHFSIYNKRFVCISPVFITTGYLYTFLPTVLLTTDDQTDMFNLLIDTMIRINKTIYRVY